MYSFAYDSYLFPIALSVVNQEKTIQQDERMRWSKPTYCSLTGFISDGGGGEELDDTQIHLGIDSLGKEQV